MELLEKRIGEVITQTPAIAERMQLMDNLFNPGTTMDSPGVVDTLAAMSDNAREFFNLLLIKTEDAKDVLFLKQ